MCLLLKFPKSTAPNRLLCFKSWNKPNLTSVWDIVYFKFRSGSNLLWFSYFLVIDSIVTLKKWARLYLSPDIVSIYSKIEHQDDCWGGYLVFRTKSHSPQNLCGDFFLSIEQSQLLDNGDTWLQSIQSHAGNGIK